MLLQPLQSHYSITSEVTIVSETTELDALLGFRFKMSDVFKRPIADLVNVWSKRSQLVAGRIYLLLKGVLRHFFPEENCPLSTTSHTAG